MSATPTFKTSTRPRLFTPGPVEIPVRILRPMSQVPPHHRTEGFRATYSKVSEDLKWLHQTQGEVLMLAASGLAVIFGLIGVINMGHGAMMTLGAYFTWAATQAGIPFPLAVILAASGVGLVGFLLEHLLIRQFYDRPF